ncbi:MAG: hypothetical protein GYA24_19835 [Candidatus Lokiarchaeota archaeon]|nr:hypothetical protein [Candidatus Lokiarchaeota archaeon]
MTSDLQARLHQLAGIIRLTGTVDIGRACSITRLPESTFRKAFALLKNDTSFKGQFVSPALYNVQQNVEGFISALSAQVLAIAGQAPVHGPANNPRIVEKSPGIMARMEKLFKASRRIKIDDACAVAGLDRTELIGWIIDESERLGVKVDGDYLVVGEDVDTSAWLDEQFSSWDKKEQQKEGKLD